MKRQSVEWQVANQEHFSACLDILRLRLQALAGLETVGIDEAISREASARSALPAPSALQQLEAAFQLTPFERELVLLCAAMETLPIVSELCALLHKDPAAHYPTFALGLAYMQDPSWQSITPEGPLRKFRLLEMEDGISLTRSRLRLPERVLHFLCGIQYIEPALAMVEKSHSREDLVPSHRQIAEQIADLWAASLGKIPAVQLVGNEPKEIADLAARSLSLELFEVGAAEIGDPQEFLNLWTREALLLSGALLIKSEAADAAKLNTLARRSNFPLFIGTQDTMPIEGSKVFEIAAPTPAEVKTVWQAELGEAAHGLNGSLDTLAKHFRLSPDQIRQAAQAADRSDLNNTLWEESRKQSRKRLDDLALRIDSKMEWKDLVLPDQQSNTLKQITSHVRQRAKVYDAWGFGSRNSRGLGISALFSGPSGTGKTLAAEVIAGELKLDLYRIDLSQIVSKYIGETEKNLRRIFEAAEGSGAVLLFDEADALFGKRSEVKDSHDRYANIEVGYLLQRMEAYQGLVILTTNLKNALDTAFLRRLRFVVQFPFPEYDDRCRIWDRVFPAAMPSEKIENERLAELSLAGGSIRNVAMNAAFLAADEGSVVKMDHIVRAARSEFTKLERPMTEFSLEEDR